MRLWPRKKRFWPLAFLAWMFCLGFLGLLASCGPTRLALSRAHMTPHGPAATPPLLPEGTDVRQWEDEIRPKLARALQREVYGVLPDKSATRIVSHRLIADSAFHDRARVEEYVLVGEATYNGQTNPTKPFHVVLVLPKQAAGPVPVILMESFCPNQNSVPVKGVSIPSGVTFSCDGKGLMAHVMRYVFGRYIATPPIEMILDHGYGLAAFYPGEYVPDRAQSGLAALKGLTNGYSDEASRMGAIAAWGWGYSRVVDALEQNPKIAKNTFIAYGHSRYAKAALVAGAFDPRIGAVIAHQSGTGGASLNRNKRGETVRDITKTYPHWFDQNYGRFAGHEQDMTTDQHALLALIAPRPILLGNALRDVWSDPNGAFRAARGASPVYRLYGHQGLRQTRLSRFTPSADIAFWIRPGTHGVVKEDWPAFLSFLDAHLRKH